MRDPDITTHILQGNLDASLRSAASVASDLRDRLDTLLRRLEKDGAGAVYSGYNVAGLAAELERSMTEIKCYAEALKVIKS